MTMSRDRGGVFDTLLGLARLGLGGKCGDGRQFVSWVHERDFVNAVYWLIDRDDLAGPVNVAAPNPLPNAGFMAALRAAWGVRLGLPAPRWLLEIGTFFLRTESELVLKSRRVVPGRLLDSGFRFEFPTWPEAAADLCRRWRQARAGGQFANISTSHRIPDGHDNGNPDAANRFSTSLARPRGRPA
jgi:NAD dependent epimerase/dehydratase family enzyme